MTGKMSRCNHVTSIGRISWDEIKQCQKVDTMLNQYAGEPQPDTEKSVHEPVAVPMCDRISNAEHEECDMCKVKATNLWLCLIGQCRYVGCGEAAKDHSSLHAEEKQHCLTINLSTLRIWCYRCEAEVLTEKNNPPFLIPDRMVTAEEEEKEETSQESSPRHSAFGGDDSDTDAEDDGVRPRGLTGLQNLGNTCYLNAALQALSNCPPLTRFFLDCSGSVQPDRMPMLSKNYLRLIKEVWHRKRPSYLVPSGIVSGIKLVHPMFRGYSQQDTQEFLRCFMDQLHEELKQPIIEENEEREESHFHEISSSPVIGRISSDRQMPLDAVSSSSQSDVDYETCDSALGSERGSAEQNCSSDENSDINEFSRLSLSGGGSREAKTKGVRRSRNSLSKMENGSEDSGNNHSITAKEQKDSMNLSKKAADNISLGSDDQRSDSGEFIDAETEPLRHAKYSGGKRGGHFTDKGIGVRPATKHKQQSYQTCQQGPPKSVQFRSVISDIFDGKLNSSVQCLTCERVSTTIETFQDLSLPIPTKDNLTMIHSSHHNSPGGAKGGACSEVHQTWLSWMVLWMRSWFLGPIIKLQDCLAAFFSADELKGDNMYSCEKCKKLRNGVKYSKVLQLPEILCIHLKRFRHEFYSTKIGTYVSFPLDNLDMKPYLHKEYQGNVTLYDLIAVICHHGTAGGGHYTAYCQNSLTEQWYEFDDQYVTEVDVSQVINCEAYVLFYRKQNDHMTKIRQQAVELMEQREPSLMHFYVSKEWINRFNTFAEPGPITNEDFLCPHGGVPPSKISSIDTLVEPLTQSVWEYLHDRFGGGPSCNHLFLCSQCHQAMEDLKKRQRNELDEFIKLNEKFKEEDNPSIIFAMSMSWFKEWENFAREKDDNPPGPIDNKRISIMKNGQPVLRVNSDYGQLSGEMWEFLLNIYGGGPELIIKQVIQSPTLKSMAEQVPPATTAKTDRLASVPQNEGSESPTTRSDNEQEQSRNDEQGNPEMKTNEVTADAT